MHAALNEQDLIWLLNRDFRCAAFCHTAIKAEFWGFDRLKVLLLRSGILRNVYQVVAKEFCRCTMKHSPRS